MGVPINGNVNGVRLTADAGVSIGPNGDETFVLAGVDASGAGAVVYLTQAVSGGQNVDVWFEPLTPEGERYPVATNSEIALATGMIAATEQGVYVQADLAPANVFGIGIRNNDTITHTAHVVVYGNGDS